MTEGMRATKVGQDVAAGAIAEAVATVNAGVPNQRRQVAEESGARIVIRCVADGSGDPVSGASIDAIREGVDPPVVVHLGLTDDSGRVIADPVAAGVYGVQVQHPAMVPAGGTGLLIDARSGSEASLEIPMSTVYVAVLAFGEGDKPYEVRFDVKARAYPDSGAITVHTGPVHARLLANYGPYFRVCTITGQAAKEVLTERFCLFFERHETQVVDVPLVRLDEFVAPTLFESRSLPFSGLPAPRLRLRVLDAAGEEIDAGRWMVIRDGAVCGLESVDANSNEWRALPEGRYRVRGHALTCPWVFSEQQEFELVAGGEYDVIVPANCRLPSCELRVQRNGERLDGVRARLIGKDNKGRKFAGAWRDVSVDVQLNLPVGPVGIEIMHAGVTREFTLAVSDLSNQRLVVDLGS